MVEELHDLVMAVQGHHPGILVVRKDNNPRRDLDEKRIVRALAKLLAAGVEVAARRMGDGRPQQRARVTAQPAGF